MKCEHRLVEIRTRGLIWGCTGLCVDAEYVPVAAWNQELLQSSAPRSHPCEKNEEGWTPMNNFDHWGIWILVAFFQAYYSPYFFRTLISAALQANGWRRSVAERWCNRKCPWTQWPRIALLSCSGRWTALLLPYSTVEQWTSGKMAALMLYLLVMVASL